MFMMMTKWTIRDVMHLSLSHTNTAVYLKQHSERCIISEAVQRRLMLFSFICVTQPPQPGRPLKIHAFVVLFQQLH